MHETINEYVARAAAFESAAHELFGQHEGTNSRVFQLDQTYSTLALLNIKQDELMRQGLRCTEHGLFRAAHVMAWAAFMDFYEEILESDGLLALRRERPNWAHTTTMDDLREYQAEFALVSLAQPLNLATKNEMKALQSLLNKRNQCAHPSSYSPDLNATLGYISDTLHYIGLLHGKSPS